MVAVGMLLAAAMAFATMGPVARIAYDDGASPPALLFVRFTAAALGWVVVLALLRRPVLWGHWAVPRLLAAGVIGGALAGYAEYAAYQHLKVALVIVLLFTAPVWIALAEWRLGRRRITLREVLALVAVIVGLPLLLDVRTGGVHVGGVLLALGASFGIAVFFLLAQRGVNALGVMRSAALFSFSAAVATLVMTTALEGLDWPLGSGTAVGLGVFLGLVPTALGMALVLGGISRIGAFQSSVVSATEPVFGALLAWLLLQETLRAVQGAGALLVIGGTVIIGSAGALVGRERPRREAGGSL